MTTATRTRLNSLGEKENGCLQKTYLRGLDLLTFAGTIAVAVLILAVNRAVKMKDEESYLSAYGWSLFGLAPIAIVFLGWAQVENQSMWAVRILLFIVGALIGGIGFLAIGELVRPMSKPCKVAINIGEIYPYRITNYSDDGPVTNEVVLVGLRNTGTRPIDGCQLEISRMVPHDDNIYFRVIRKDFSLVPGAPETHIKIFGWDARSDAPASIIFSQFIETDSGRQEFRTVLSHSKYTLTLRLVAAGRRSCDKDCCLRLDEEPRRLHLRAALRSRAFLLLRWRR